jgi:uncharacterized protein YqeY
MNDKIQDDLKQAMRNKDTTKLNVLRTLKTAITNASLQKGNVNESLSDMEILGIIRKQVSQRQDSINAYMTAQRQDLIIAEEAEIVVLKEFLPVEMTEAEIENLINRAITASEAVTKKDMGKAIKMALELANGRVDNKTISKMIGERLC